MTAVEIPVASESDSFCFYEAARRHGDYAMAGVAVAVQGGQPAAAFFSVADRPVRAPAAEVILKDDHNAIDKAIGTLDEIEFSGDLNASEAMKKHLAGVVFRRA